MKNNKTLLPLINIMLVAFLFQAASRGTSPVFAGGEYPNLGNQTPINVPNCNPNANTAVVSNNTQLEPVLNNPAIKVICLNPGSYSAISLDVGGTAQSPRYLIPNHNTNQPLPKPWNQSQNQRVKVSTLTFKSTYWYVVGLNVASDLDLIVDFRNGANGNVVDSLLVEGVSERLPVGTPSHSMVRIPETAYYNTIQNSVLRNPPRIPYSDSHCLTIQDSKYNTVINNQLYDCPGDGIQVGTVPTAGWDNRGNKILNNEVYLTDRLYASCTDPSIDANLNGPGNCACAENGLDIKFNVENPVTLNQDKFEVRRNVFYGFRQTHQACGGSGDNTAPGIFIHQFAQDILIEGNVIANSDTGILLKDSGPGGPDYINIFNNMLYNITRKRALHFAGGDDNQLTHNTIVLTTNNGNVTGRHSIAVIGQAGSGIISNNLVISSNDPYRGYTDVTNTSAFIVQNNGFVQSAAPITGIGGVNDMLFPDDPLENYAQHCFVSQKHTAGVPLCYPFLVPGQTAATVDTINTTNYGLAYDFFYRPRSLPYDLGATEVPIFSFFNMLPAVLKK